MALSEELEAAAEKAFDSFVCKQCDLYDRDAECTCDEHTADMMRLGRAVDGLRKAHDDMLVKRHVIFEIYLSPEFFAARTCDDKNPEKRAIATSRSSEDFEDLLDLIRETAIGLTAEEE